MPRTLYFLLTAIPLIAADPSWKTKPISAWTADDAAQILTNSPWVKRTAFAIVPERSEAQLREGGKLGGGGKRAGLGALDKSLFADPKQRPPLQVRWESAAPVRAAELTSRETDAPVWQGEYYAIAVYDVPGVTPLVQKFLAGDLKQTTTLKRSGGKPLKPIRVDIALSGDKLARIVYLFPRAAELTTYDKRIEFTSQIGRIVVTQFFDLDQMQFDGKLQL